MKALLESKADFSDLSEKAVCWVRKIGNLYPDGWYSRRFKAWLTSDDLAPYGAKTNGAAMRVSGCAYAAKNLDETVSNHHIKKVTLPDSVLEIKSCAFYKCSAIESIELGKNICRIDWAAFQGCHNLRKVTVPDKAVIESYAFEKITEIIRASKEEYNA